MDDSLASRIDAALRDLMSDDHLNTSENAHRQLVEIGAFAVPALTAALDDPAKRTKVLDVLRALGETAASAISKVLQVVRKDYDFEYDFQDVFYSDEAHAAAEALIAMGSAAAEPVLQGLRSADEDGCRFYQCVLSRLPPEAVVPLLIAGLSEVDGQFRLRILFVVTLLGSAAAPAIPILIQLLHETAVDVRAAAAHALGSIGEAAVPHLWPLADSREVHVAVASLQALGCHGEQSELTVFHDEESLLALLERKLIGVALPVRVAAALALHRVVNFRVESTLDRVLSSDEADYELTDAIRSLAGLHRPWGINNLAAAKLRSLVSEPEIPFSVRRAAATVLLDMRDVKSIDRVLPIVGEGLRDPEDPHYLVYMDAVRHAGALAAPLVPDILIHLRLMGTCRRIAALSTLGGIGVGSQEVFDAILPLLDNPNRRLASAATEVLGIFGPAPLPVVHALARQLSRGWNEYRVAVALGRIGPAAAAAVPALVEAAHRTRGREGGWCAEALGKIGTPEAIAALKAMYDGVTVDYGEWASAGAVLGRLGVPLDGTGTPVDPGRTRADDSHMEGPAYNGETDTGGKDHTSL